MSGRSLSVAVLLVLLVMTPFLVLGQQPTVITGKVTDEAGEPLPGANVIIQLTNLGAATDAAGKYRFTVPASAVKGQQVTLEARFIGYRTKTAKIVLKPGTITRNFSLPVDVLDMDAIVVTGVVEETPKTKLAFSVARVEGRLLEEVPSTSPETALYGKVAGVKVVRANGQPGTSASIQLRAPTSINASGRSQDPLYIVDGVIIDPSVTGSPLTDIPAEDIESIEVVKGAAGASLYGARAANGVIRITTKRGSHLGLRQTKIRVRSEFGGSTLGKKLSLNRHHGWKIANSSYTDANGKQVTPGDFIDNDGNFVDPRQVGGRVPDTYVDPSVVPYAAGIEFYDNPYKYVATGELGTPLRLLKRPFDQVDRFFGAGEFLSNSVSISRNMEKTNFLISFGNYAQAGVVKGLDGFTRRSARINLDHKFHNNFNIGVTGLFSQTKRDLTVDSGGPFFALTFMAPDADLAAKGSNDSLFIQPDPTSVEDNPLYFIQYNDRDDSRRRVMGSFNVSWIPTNWLSIDGNFSYDRSDRRNEAFWPIGYNSITPGPEITGRYVIGNALDEALNGSLTAAFSRQFGDLVVRAKARGLFERTEFRFAQGDGRDLAVKGVRSLSIATPAKSFLNSTLEQVRSDGYSGIVGFDYKDRYIGDFLVRRDGSSLFGPRDRWHTYYRVSGAYRISREPWWFLSAFNEFKLRGSYGTAGGRPNFFARFETWSVSAGKVTKQNLGNKSLKPEFAKELELGIDATFLSRFSLEFTYARSVVNDQILFVPLPAYTGYGNQWRNAGTLKTNTIELTLDASLKQTRTVSWSAGLTFDRTRQRIAALDVPPYRVGPFFITDDEDLGAIYGDRWISSLNDLPAGIPRDQFNVNDDGFVVWVGEGHTFRDGIADTLWGQSVTLTDQFGVDHSFKWGVPIKFQKAVFDSAGNFLKYDEFVRLGSTVPDFNFGFNSTLRYKGLTIYTLFDAQIGGKIYNNTNQWGLRELKLGEVDQFGKPDELKKPGLYYATLYDVNATNSHFVEDATYLKLRELRVSYSFGRQALTGVFGGFLRKLTIGVVGRNLLTFTGYKGYDPEVGSRGFGLGSAAVARYDGFGYPNFRTFSGLLEFEF